MSKYIKKPIVIVDAIQFNGKNHKAIYKFTCPDIPKEQFKTIDTTKPHLFIECPDGKLITLLELDWIIKGESGYITVMKPKMFNACYEVVK